MCISRHLKQLKQPTIPIKQRTSKRIKWAQNVHLLSSQAAQATNNPHKAKNKQENQVGTECASLVIRQEHQALKLLKQPTIPIKQRTSKRIKWAQNVHLSSSQAAQATNDPHQKKKKKKKKKRQGR